MPRVPECRAERLETLTNRIGGRCDPPSLPWVVACMRSPHPHEGSWYMQHAGWLSRHRACEGAARRETRAQCNRETLARYCTPWHAFSSMRCVFSRANTAKCLWCSLLFARPRDRPAASGGFRGALTSSEARTTWPCRGPYGVSPRPFCLPTRLPRAAGRPRSTTS